MRNYMNAAGLFALINLMMPILNLTANNLTQVSIGPLLCKAMSCVHFQTSLVKVIVSWSQNKNEQL